MASTEESRDAAAPYTRRDANPGTTPNTTVKPASTPAGAQKPKAGALADVDANADADDDALAATPAACSGASPVNFTGAEDLTHSGTERSVKAPSRNRPV